jgi:LEA14-like dessication related protein
MELTIFAKMNKQNLTLLLVGGGIAGLIAWQFFRKGRALKNLNFGIKGIDVDTKKKVVAVDFRIINPTKTPIRVDSIVCDLLLQDSAIGTLTYLVPTTIEPLKETILRIPVKLNPASLVTFFTDILLTKSSKLDFVIKGVVSAENILFPVNVPYSFDLTPIKNLLKKKN